MMPTTESEGSVLVHRHGEDGQLAELVMNRPEALNAISTGHAEAMIAAIGQLADDETVRAVVLSSSVRKAFCVGADLKERNRFSDAELFAQRPLMRRLYGGLVDLPMPAVAAVHGYAMGGGFELALSCDLIVADGSAVFGLPEVTVGLVPGGGGTQLLVRRVGAGRSADLIYTGRRVSAEEGFRLGFVDRLVGADAGDARTVALELAGQIAANSPVGVRNAKRALRLGADVDLRTGFEIEDASWRATAFSPDRREGIAAFNEKRPPVWH